MPRPPDAPRSQMQKRNPYDPTLNVATVAPSVVNGPKLQWYVPTIHECSGVANFHIRTGQLLVRQALFNHPSHYRLVIV